MSVSKTDLTFFLTSAIPMTAQGDASLSLGGFPSTSQLSSPFASLFDIYFNTSLSQYRCIALCNTNQTQTSHAVSFYLNTAANGNNTRIAVEMPATDAVMGTASAGTLLSLTDSSIPYADNAFDNCVVQMKSGLNIGQYRQVSSYDASLHTVVLNSQLPYPVSSGDGYVIYPSPSSKIISGQITPVFGAGNISSLSAPTKYTQAISPNVTGNRLHGSDLWPNDVIYLWIARQLTPNLPAYDNNGIVIATRFSY